MVGWDRSDPWEKRIACAGPFSALAAKGPAQQPKMAQT
ncbi:hypothetical protein FHW75_002095 [Pseudomonas sp. OG7]|jgi:hypothetical protein|nr:hypothetical protein [Pseudomonas sp. OG7]